MFTGAQIDLHVRHNAVKSYWVTIYFFIKNQVVEIEIVEANSATYDRY